MATTMNINDLPDDMLYEIFGHIFSARALSGQPPDLIVTDPPRGMHRSLRRVCRRWQGLADWARLDNASIEVRVSALPDSETARARYPTACKKLSFFTIFDTNRSGSEFIHSSVVQRAVGSVITRSPELRRTLAHLHLECCCLAALARAVPPISTCTRLTQLMMAFHQHRKQRVVPDTVLAPFSALKDLRVLVLAYMEDAQQGSKVPLASWPILPDAPRLTQLVFQAATNFQPRGSDAVLAGLRKFVLHQTSLPSDTKSTEDWFGLRAALDAGTWRPQLMTGVDKIQVILKDTVPTPTPFRPPRARAAVGAEWLPLAHQVTELEILMRVPSRTAPPSTGIAAGLGVLTALKSLRVTGSSVCTKPEFQPPLDFARLRLPYLTQLHVDCVPTTIDLAAFPDLVDVVAVTYKPRQPPILLNSLAARTRLQKLFLATASPVAPTMNLAELFAGGGGLPALRVLGVNNMVLTWDTAGLSGVPSAAEFGVAVRTLVPSLTDANVMSRTLPGGARDAAVAACAGHVVPALLAAATPKRPRPGADNPAAKPDAVRDAGNKAYADQRWADAIDAYSRALAASTYGTANWIAAVSNRAAAKLGAGDAEGAACDADAVLVTAPANVKARLRRALARERVGNKDGAAFDYEKVLKLLPNSVQAAEGLERVRG